MRLWRRIQGSSSAAADQRGHLNLGDRVRIAATPETRATGWAGREGTYCGFTTPSVTEIEVIGRRDDLGYNVLFDNEQDDAWFDPSLVERLGFDPDGTVVFGDKRFRRAADGDWIPDPS